MVKGIPPGGGTAPPPRPVLKVHSSQICEGFYIFNTRTLQILSYPIDPFTLYFTTRELADGACEYLNTIEERGAENDQERAIQEIYGSNE